MRDTRRTRLLLGVALSAALVLIAVDYGGGSSPLVRTMRGAAATVFGGAERAFATVASPVGRFFDSGLAGSGSGSATALHTQLVRMRAELSAASLSKTQYRELRRLLQVGGRGGYRLLAASVIAFGQGVQQTVTLDAGSTDGIKPQMTVINADGLVGRVIAVTARTSTVLLASDTSSVVGVRLALGGQIGWVTGTGGGRSGAPLLRLQVLDPAALRPGVPLVTAASVNDRPFVPGVPVGEIVSVRNRGGALTGQAMVRPFATFSSLDVVGVVVAAPRHNPRFSVLPPRPPSPSPSPSPSASSSLPSSGPSRRGPGHG